MARFKYLGEPPRPDLVISYGKTVRIVVPNKDGSKTVIDAPSPDGFPIGDVVDYDFSDPRALESMRADERFEEV